MKKTPQKLGIYLIILIFLVIFLISFSSKDRVSNLNSCEGEHNKNEKSITTVIYKDGTTDFFTDYCVGNVLYEFYCVSNEEMRSEKLFCPGGCIDGMCFSSKQERLDILGLAPIEDSPGGTGSSVPSGAAPSLGGRGLDDHTFFRGEGPEVPIEYLPPEQEQEGLIVPGEQPPALTVTEDEPTKPIVSPPDTLKQMSELIKAEPSSQEDINTDFFTIALIEETHDDVLEGYIGGTTEYAIRTAPPEEGNIMALKENGEITITFFDPIDPGEVILRLKFSERRLQLEIP
ncbi:MAG: hypothetical protein ABIB47_00585 [Candidatus Woesearchaeota archaeon]